MTSTDQYSQQQCAFPLFRQKFFGAALWANSDMDLGGGHDQGPAGGLQRPNLRTLDLKALPRDDGPVSETQLRRQKYAFFEKQCSRIEDGLFLSGDCVARSWETLQANGVTHVLNCVGFICKEYFKDRGLTYRTYYLHDTPGEDILTVLYDALEYIDDALKSGGHVLVHCSQGVSRSATIVIGYLMWKTGRSYDEVFAHVKEARGVANPNIGFTCQLLQWQKRRALNAPARIRLYRMAPHCPQAPLILVPKSVSAPKQYPNNTYRELDRRGAFVIHTPNRVYVWIGAVCPAAYATAARYHAKLLLKYEQPHLLQQYQGSQEPAILEVMQGAEPAELMSLLDPPLLDPEAARLHARRASMAEELATGSTACNPAGLDPMEVCSIPVGTAAPAAASAGGASASGAGAAGGAQASPRVGGVAGAGGGAAAAAAAGGGGGASRLSSQWSRPQSGSATPRQGCWVIGDVDDYTHEYRMYIDAVRLGEGSSSGAGSLLMEGVPSIRTTMRSSTSIGPDSPAATTAALVAGGGGHGLGLGGLSGLSAALMDGIPSRPDSPATAEGRMKKYRRSESELRIAIAHKSHHTQPLPSLHTSMGDDEMSMS